MDADVNMESNERFMHIRLERNAPQLPDWAIGRRVAIRPDVPGHRFHPEDAYILTTPRRKEIAAAVLGDLYTQYGQGDQPQLPEWLAEPIPPAPEDTSELTGPEV